MRAVVALTVLTACGRIGFAVQVDGAPGDVGGTPDAAVAPNLVFVSSSATSGMFGGTGAADASCTMEATAAGLPGTYVAWLATSTTAASARFGAARGWVRVDGAPVADTIAGIFTGEMFNTIDIDEKKLIVTDQYAFTGTNISGGGEQLGNTCSDWTATGSMATVGYMLGSTPDGIYGAITPCTIVAHLYCFGVDRTAVVAPVASGGGRIAFVSKPVSAAATLAGFDSQCQSDATAAGLTGSFLAATATQTTTIASRFTTDARPWQRVDGTTIAADGASLFASAGRMLSFVNQRADGTYVGGTAAVYIWTGAATPSTLGSDTTTCGGWTSTATTGDCGAAHIAEASAFWAAAQCPCIQVAQVLCLEQ